MKGETMTANLAKLIHVEELTEAHALLDRDGMIYAVSKIERSGETVRFTATHRNNDMLMQQIEPRAVEMKRGSRVNILEPGAVSPTEAAQAAQPGRVLLFARPASGQIGPLNEATEAAANQHVESIRQLMSEGIKRGDAIRLVRSRSALGEMAWQKIIAALPADEIIEDASRPHFPQCGATRRAVCPACDRAIDVCESVRCTTCRNCGNDLRAAVPAKKPLWCRACLIEHGDQLSDGVIFANHARRCDLCGKGVLTWAVDAHRRAKHADASEQLASGRVDTLPTGPRDVSADVLKVEALFEQILATDLPKAVDRQNRQDSRKQIAADIRALLSRLKLKGISVTAPNYSMAQSVRINLPTVPNDYTGCDNRENDFREHRVNTCRHCHLQERARRRLEAIILAAYPALDNRSDSMTDHFDYRLSVS
jgi:hypothetical protein